VDYIFIIALWMQTNMKTNVKINMTIWETRGLMRSEIEHFSEILCCRGFSIKVNHNASPIFFGIFVLELSLLQCKRMREEVRLKKTRDK
jgi:hypothetical protein